MIADDLAAFLARREPIFHNPEVIWDEASFDAEIASNFREIGASGSCYERQAIKDVVLGRLAGTHEDSLADDFRMDDVEVIQLSHTIIQVRYTLLTDARVTRRSTLYRRNSDTGYWQAVFHRGTVVAD